MEEIWQTKHVRLSEDNKRIGCFEVDGGSHKNVVDRACIANNSSVSTGNKSKKFWKYVQWNN